MRLGPTSFGGYSRQPLVMVQTPHGVKQMTLKEAEKRRNGGGGEEPEDPLSRLLKWIEEKLSSFGV